MGIISFLYKMRNRFIVVFFTIQKKNIFFSVQAENGDSIGITFTINEEAVE